MPTVDKVHVDQHLSNISLAYKNEAFIADTIFKPISVSKRSDKYYVWGYEMFRQNDDARSPGTIANEIQFTLSDDTYYCEGHALSAFIPDEEYANADDALINELETSYTELITNGILLNKEVDAANKLADTSLIDSSLSVALGSSGTYKWDNYTDSDPLINIENAKSAVHKKSGITPNTLVLSKPVFDVLRMHPKLLAKLPVTALNMMSAEQLRMLFGVDNLLIGSALKDTAPNPAQNPALGYIWGNNAILCYVNPANLGRKSMTTAATFMWDAEDGGSVQVRRYREDRAHANIIEVQRYYDQKILAKNASFIFASAIA
jgi:hypothetical protein